MAPLQTYELFDYKYILKYICFIEKCLKNCAQKYIKKCLAKSYKYHQARLWITFMGGNFTLPAYLIVAVVASGAGVSGKRLVYSLNCSPQISENLAFVEPPGHTQASEAITETEFL